MNILVINWQDIKNPLGGGAEVHLHEIFKRIVPHVSSITLFCSEFEGCKQEEMVDGIRVIRQGKRNTFNFGVKKAYKNRFRHEKFDIVIDDVNKIPFYTPRFVREPILGISHHFFGTSIFKEAGLIAGLYVYMAEWYMKFVYKKTPFAVVSESTLNEFVERGYPRKNFTIIPNAVSSPLFQYKVINKTAHPSIAYFGRLKKYKSVQHLLQSLPAVLAAVPETTVDIIGSGDYRAELEQSALRLGVSQAVTFHGFVTEERKVELLERSWVTVNTSMKEGWGISTLEGNACGTPAIAANVPGLRDAVKHGETGILYEYGNTHQLAAELINLLHDSELRMRLSHQAAEWAATFTWDASAAAMLALIQEIATT